MKPFPHIRLGHTTWFGESHDLDWWIRAAPQSIRSLFLAPSEVRWKMRSGQDLVSARIGTGQDARDVILKWRRVSGSRTWKNLFRPSRAAREFENALRILHRGVVTPRPMLWGELRRFGLLRGEYLVMEWLRDVASLVEKLRETATDPSRRTRLLLSSARSLREMHDSGIFHGDLNSSNILLRECGTNCQAMIIDFTASKDLRSLSEHHRKKDLERFLSSLLPFVTEEEKNLFLSSYEASPSP